MNFNFKEYGIVSKIVPRVDCLVWYENILVLLICFAFPFHKYGFSYVLRLQNNEINVLRVSP